MLSIPYFTCGYASAYSAYPVAPPMPHFVADFPQAKFVLHGNRPFCVFESPPPFGEFRGTYDVHVRLIIQ